jgi:aldehyde:ferredoxin oxidoreductase
MAEYGYAGRILLVDLSDDEVATLATADYADRFIGGRGLAAKLFWDLVPPGTGAFSPQNCLICATGPVAGFPGFAGGRWQVCGKSPITDPEQFSYASLGERWGIRLKFAGYDALVIRGKAHQPVYLYLHDNAVEFRDASILWGKSAFLTCRYLKEELGNGVNVMAIGTAAENMVSFATVFTDEGSSGSSGMGGVMGSKNLKAVVVAGDKRIPACDSEKLNSLANHILAMRKIFYPNSSWVIPNVTRPHMCYWCGLGCSRHSYVNDEGQRLKLHCIPAGVYRNLAEKYYPGHGNEITLGCVRLFDQYGLDAVVMRPLVEWLLRCYQGEILNEEQTGLPLSKIGSMEFMETLVRKIAMREGFGALLAEGLIKAADSLGVRAKELLLHLVSTAAGEGSDYDPRLILHNALLLATEPRRPVSQLHEAGIALLRWRLWVNGVEGESLSSRVMHHIAERFWGSALASDYNSYEGKALAAKKIQDRTHAKESLVLCDLVWPIMYTEITDDKVGDPSLESQIISAVTGRELDEHGLNMVGERVFNLQRALRIREGGGGREHDQLLGYLFTDPLQSKHPDLECRVPGPDGEVESRRGAVVDRQKFEEIKTEYYKLRGWDAGSGLQTVASLQALHLEDIAQDLVRRGLIK